jgi:3-mercaptopyruvate sulfurtransferase SseA
VAAACNSAESRKPLATATHPGSQEGQVATTYADGIPRITINELEELRKTGKVFIADVRNQTAYDQGHIPGAKLIPVQDVAKRIDEFPRDRQIVTYCS